MPYIQCNRKYYKMLPKAAVDYIHLFAQVHGVTLIEYSDYDFYCNQ